MDDPGAIVQEPTEPIDQHAVPADRCCAASGFPSTSTAGVVADVVGTVGAEPAAAVGGAEGEPMGTAACAWPVGLQNTQDFRTRFLDGRCLRTASIRSCLGIGRFTDTTVPCRRLPLSRDSELREGESREPTPGKAIVGK